MIKAALAHGVTAAFPALNYRTDAELRKAIEDIKSATAKPFGVNLIVNKSNPKYKGQLEILLDMKVSYIITSLGSPREVIEKCKPLGIKVFCDVVDLGYTKKVGATITGYSIPNIWSNVSWLMKFGFIETGVFTK